MSAGEHDQRLEEAVAFALGSLDAEQLDDFKEHLKGCERCQEEIRWLAPAVRALPEAVEARTPPPALKERLMAEVRADAAADAEQSGAAAEGAPSRSQAGFGEWLRGLRIAGLTWKPLAGLAVAVVIVAGGIGFAVGGGGGGSGATHTWEIEPGANGIEAKVVREGEKAEVRLAGVGQLPQGKVLEAWVERDGKVEAVPALFAPDGAGDATTTIENMEGVTTVMVTREPAGGSKKPTEEPPMVVVPLES
ncbi:MAG: anti-sigma factor [Solirubrobacterales bacterium]